MIPAVRQVGLYLRGLLFALGQLREDELERIAGKHNDRIARMARAELARRRALESEES